MKETDNNRMKELVAVLNHAAKVYYAQDTEVMSRTVGGTGKKNGRYACQQSYGQCGVRSGGGTAERTA